MAKETVIIPVVFISFCGGQLKNEQVEKNFKARARKEAKLRADERERNGERNREADLFGFSEKGSQWIHRIIESAGEVSRFQARRSQWLPSGAEVVPESHLLSCKPPRRKQTKSDETRSLSLSRSLNQYGHSTQ